MLPSRKVVTFKCSGILRQKLREPQDKKDQTRSRR
jgi:hypothetical protein